MSRTIRLLMVVLLALAGAAVAVPAVATEGYCGLTWGSTPRELAPLGRAPVVAVRTGQHGCFDRVVFELDGPAAGWTVSYVDQVTQDGSGAVLPVPGGARLQVQLHHPGHDDDGNTTVPSPIAQPAGPTLRSVVYGGSFEGYSTFGVGTRARLPFRVFALAGPGGHSRIVLDVAHRWS